MNTPVWLFRYDNEDGSAKDWAYPVNTSAQDANLTVFFGRSGSALRQANTPAKACQRHDPAYEAQCRSQAKLAKGYYALGEQQLDAKRRVIRAEKVAVVEPEVVDLPRRWYWRAPVLIEAPLRQALADLAERLYAVGWLTTKELQDVQRQPHDLWLRITGCQAHGAVTLDTSHLIQIASLLSLSRSHDTVHLANQDGQTVTDWPSEVPVTDEVLVILDLRTHHPARWLSADANDEWFF